MGISTPKLTAGAIQASGWPAHAPEAAPWRQLNLRLSDVNPMNSMITPDEAFYLHWLARDYYKGHGEIIDGGPLLGGSTLALATGLDQNMKVENKRKRIHSYDLFTYFNGFKDSVLPNADDFDLKEGDTLLPLFQKNTEKYVALIQVVPGDIQSHHWDGTLVELLFIDLAKSWQINNHIIREFFGSLIPNQSIVIHQDYFHYGCPWIHLTMQLLAPYFRVIHAPEGGTLSFVLIKEIPNDLLMTDYQRYFMDHKDEAVSLMDRAIAALAGYWKLIVMAAKVYLLTEHSDFQGACEVAHETRCSDDWDDIVLYDIIHAERNIPDKLLFHENERNHLIGMSRNYNIFGENGTVYAYPHPLGKFATEGKAIRQLLSRTSTAPTEKSLPDLEEIVGEKIFYFTPYENSILAQQPGGRH